MRQPKRRIFTGIFALAMVPLLAASAAYACQRLVTLHANPSSAAAGAPDAVTVTGANYSMDSTSSPVDIRLDTRNGRVLSSVPVSQLSGGRFTRTVTIPADTAIGNHILVATQTLANGAPCVGCPGRANISVTAAAASASGTGSAAPAASDNQQASEPAQSSQPSGASQPSGSQPASEPATASQATATEPAEAGSAPSASTQEASPAAPVSAAGPPAARPAAAAPIGPAPAAPGNSPSAPATAVEVAPPAPEATVTYDSGSSAPPAPPASGILLPAASGERPSMVPSLTLVAGLALVLLSLGAIWKNGSIHPGGRRFTPAS